MGSLRKYCGSKEVAAISAPFPSTASQLFISTNSATLPESIAASSTKTTWSPYYPLCAFGQNTVAASIDTPLHAFLPARHIDHLHPDWGIALAAAANGEERMQEFNRRFNHQLVWLPWQRPGFELGLMLKRAVEANPNCDGIVLGGHGLFSWGETSESCYLNTIELIDQLGQFVQEHVDAAGNKIFGGPLYSSHRRP